MKPIGELFKMAESKVGNPEWRAYSMERVSEGILVRGCRSPEIRASNLSCSFDDLPRSLILTHEECE